MDNNTIQRKIFFYRFKFNPIDNYININTLLEQYLNKLKLYKQNNKFHNLKNSSILIKDSHDRTKSSFIDITYMDDKKVRGIICSLRDSAFPYLFNILNGDKKGIEASIDDNLLETTHFIIYLNEEIIVSEYNYYGIRIEKLKYLLRDALNIQKDFLDIYPILNSLNNKELIENGIVKNIDLSFSYPGLDYLKSIMNLCIEDSIDENFNNTDDIIVEIKIRGKNKLFFKDKIPFITKLFDVANNVKSQYLDDTGKLINTSPIKKNRISYKPNGNSKIVTTDLFEERLFCERSITKIDPKYKYIESENMFENLEDAYDNYKSCF